jgi:hypothetical protein
LKTIKETSNDDILIFISKVFQIILAKRKQLTVGIGATTLQKGESAWGKRVTNAILKLSREKN